MGNIERDEALNIYNTTGLDIDGRMDDMNHHAKQMEQDIRQMIMFMKLVPGFKSLCVTDQTTLVKGENFTQSKSPFFYLRFKKK